jgi:tetratricopeptide (TPR) repeat protein
MIRTAMRHYEYIESEDSYEMAVEWVRFRNYERAEACLRRAIELNPRFTYAYMDLALVYARQKKYAQAAAAVRKAIKADPSFHRLYYLVAKYAFRAGDFPLAVKYIDRAIGLSPERLYVKARTIIRRGRERR